jgi:predicted AAA+ superfamily ATPase
MPDSLRRALHPIAFTETLGRQIRFIAGPRQCGKTTFAKQQLIATKSTSFYYNWDQIETRQRYRKEPSFLTADLLKFPQHFPWVCFDEIHKVSHWKDILKGQFDAYEDQVHFVITGSARLDMMRRAGDSLAGRYFLFHLGPLMLSEVIRHESILPQSTATETVEQMMAQGEASTEMESLLQFSGFPEPFLAQSNIFSKKWRASYIDRLIKEDLRDLSSIHMLDKIQGLIYLLPERIGSPLSINSLREDLELNHSTVTNYIRFLELIYVIFSLSPYSKKGSTLVKKERKIYFFDWTLLTDEAARFENYVAAELKARTDLWSDATGDAYTLSFVRTKDGLESDFLILKDARPYLLFEAKLSDESVRSHHHRHRKILGDIPFIQIVRKPSVFRTPEPGIYIVSAGRLLA